MPSRSEISSARDEPPQRPGRQSGEHGGDEAERRPTPRPPCARGFVGVVGSSAAPELGQDEERSLVTVGDLHDAGRHGVGVGLGRRPGWCSRR